MTMNSMLLSVSKAFAVVATFYLLTVGTYCANSRRPKKKWALIVAGAKDYRNYFSQSLACHAYNTLRRGGIPKENIVHMSFDDVAHHTENPYPGNLVTDVGGPNVYNGCEIDYRGKDANIQVFLKVLSGDKKSVKAMTGRRGKVIESGSDDHIFLYMVDHGAPGGIFFFPDRKPLFAEDLTDAIIHMHTFDKFQGMVLYVESCYAGSMFYDLLPDNIGVYAVTFANSTEESYKCCYDQDRRAYVGSVSGNAWMENADSSDKRTETFQDQLRMEKKTCNDGANKGRTSHPQEFGDIRMRAKLLSEFMGDTSHRHVKRSTGSRRNKINAKDKDKFDNSDSHSDIRAPTLRNDSRFSDFLKIPASDMVPLATVMRQLSDPSIAKDSHEELMEELRELILIEKVFEFLAGSIVAEVLKDASKSCGINLSPMRFLKERQVIQNRSCYRTAFHQVNRQCPVIDSHRFPHLRRNYQILINLCNSCDDSNVVFRAIDVATTQLDSCRTLIQVAKLQL